MKTVFNLRDELLINPRRLEKTRALTPDESKPHMGLIDEHGLFGSAEWWDSIQPPKKSPFATTGVQANFQRLSNGRVTSNGHLNIIL